MKNILIIKINIYLFSVNRGKEILSQNPTLSTSDISSILEDEWTHLEPVSFNTLKK